MEFEGNIKKPNIDIWELIGQVLKNAFIQALYPSLENSVNIGLLSKGGNDKVLQSEISKSGGGVIKNNTEEKKSKKEIRKEKRAKKKADKEKAKEKKKKEEAKNDKK